MFDYENYHRISDEAGNTLMTVERKGEDSYADLGEVLAAAIQVILHEVAEGLRPKPREIWINGTRGRDDF